MALKLHGSTTGSTSTYQSFTTVTESARRCFITGASNIYITRDDGVSSMIALLGSQGVTVDLGVVDPSIVKVKNVGSSAACSLWSISAGESR